MILDVAGSGNEPAKVLSRQNEKFLIGQSRKFLLTAERQRDGTNCDEPRGTRLVGVAKADQGRGDHTTLCSGTNGSERPVGSPASGPDEKTGRRGGSPWVARTTVQPADRRSGPAEGGEDFATARMARFRADVR